MRRAIYILLSIIGVLLLLVAGLFAALQTGFARDQARLLIADMTAGTSTHVRLDAIEGLLPFDMRLIGISLSDRDGTWLTADRASVRWPPLALLSGRLQIDEIGASTIDLARPPVADGQAPEPAPSGPLVPELPVTIDLRSLSIERLALAAPILGEPAALSLQGSAKFGEPAEGLSVLLAMRQLAGNTGTATIDLAYRPNEDFFRLMGKVDEPQGGVLGKLIGLPRGSNLQIALEGEGPLEAWQGHANAKLNGKQLLDLTADVRGDDARTITFALQAAPDEFVPEKMRPLIVGGVNAEGTVEVRPGGGTIGVSGISATAAAGQVSASGVLGLTEPGDLSVTGVLADSSPFATLVPDITWSGANLQARLQGPIDRPHVTGEIVAQALAPADLRIGTTKLTFDVSAEQGFEQPIGVRADLHMSDFTAADQRLAALLTDGAHLSLAGSLDQAGTLVADKLELRGAKLSLSGTARAEQWGAAARQADATLTIADISAIGGPLGFPGVGTAEVTLKLAPAESGERLEVSGTSQALSLGMPIADRLLGQSPSLHLVLTGNLPQEMTISTAQLAGAKARFDAQGTLAQQDLDLTFTAELPDTAAIDPTLRGEITLGGKVSGTMEAPTLVAELKSPALTIADRRLQQVRLNTTAVDLLSNPDIALEGTATLDRLPTKVATKVAIEGERIAVPNLVLTLGQTRMTGDFVMAGGLLTGKADLNAPDLRELGQLAGTAVSGDLSASLQLNDSNGWQGAILSATGHRIAAADAFTTRSLDVRATADDLFGAPAITADLDLAQPTIADRPFTEASLRAKGPLSALQTRLSLAGTDLTAAAAAEIAQIADGYRINLQTLTADVSDVQVKAERPATIEVGAKATRIDDFVLAIEDGSVRLDGSVAPDDMQLTAAVQSLPVSIARAFAPDLPITGRLDGEVQVSGTPAAPSGRFTIAGKGIGATGVAEQQADLQVAGTLQQGRLELNGELKPKSGGTLAFTAALPSLTSDARLEAGAKGTFDLLLVDAFLAGGADRVRGKAELDLSATGRLSAPELRGSLRLVDSRYENLRYGIKLRRIEADIRAEGPAIQIASLSATTPGGGHITGEGQVDLARGIETALTIRAQNATILDTDLAAATIDSDLAISGNLQSRMKLGGSVKIVKADIRVPDHLPPSVQEIQVVEVNAPPRVAARLAEHDQPPQQTVIVDLDLAVGAPQQIFVRGRGLDAELGGNIHIGGTSEKPEIDGAFKLRRGSLDIAARRLEFTEGQMTFEGGDQIDPILDLTAVTRAQDLEVTAKVEGSARAPRITLSSVPTMPEDEILARLLFSKSAGALSAFELLQLAQATADLAGVSTGPGVLDKLRKSTGLDRLSLEQAEGTTGPSLTAGRYVAEGVYVGVSQGAKAGSSAATVEIEVTPNIKVETEIGANATSKAGVNLEWDY
ncbi:translocation/assembly module TamB domain-containing protein [Dongia deserti]|uniref:translocation/assembly module TamB domain-containing protein n=1 Tax=Dongia deserti TaxID=2268030 RepID=UPI000E6552D5|nr:translocation/assembly module TamB domain-containing protein [Dongia deserti]